MQSNKSWFVVYTKPKSERKVADSLRKKKFKCYYPNQVQYWEDKRKVVNVPLFTSLVFVYATEKDHSTIKQIEGVSGFLYWLQKPAVINNDEISSIRYFLERHTNIKLERIEIASDPDEKNKTAYPQIQPYAHINVYKVSLPSLGYALVSESVVESERVVA